MMRRFTAALLTTALTLGGASVAQAQDVDTNFTFPVGVTDATPLAGSTVDAAALGADVAENLPDGLATIRTVRIDQDSARRETEDHMRALRTKAWNDPNAYLDGVPLREFAATHGISSLDDYLAVEWNPALEAGAVQRATEAGVHFAHERPTGEESNTAFDTFRGDYDSWTAENLGMRGARSFDDEYAPLMAARGNYAAGGHMYWLLHPSIKSFAAATAQHAADPNTMYQWSGSSQEASGTSELGKRNGEVAVAVAVPESWLDTQPLSVPGTITVGNAMRMQEMRSPYADSRMYAGHVRVSGELTSADAEIVEATSTHFIGRKVGSTTLTFTPRFIRGGVVTADSTRAVQSETSVVNPPSGSSGGGIGIIVAVIVALLAALGMGAQFLG
ncbi:hypothetical protein H0194_02740 [Corynebacterium incognita]|uniref:SCP domain-containing protein n=1 Tax=Corynebacterium incognita TaxID=2754725 RepID=A0A7G7CQU9_9CORY|nr:hypothetical protein [Corynebacterium incognita]QNE89965.1 hypothetical protein H0194_02740 [Corynebacterium incognita]